MEYPQRLVEHAAERDEMRRFSAVGGAALQQRQVYARLDVFEARQVLHRPGGGTHLQIDARTREDLGVTLSEGVVGAVGAAGGDGDPRRRYGGYDLQREPKRERA